MAFGGAFAPTLSASGVAPTPSAPPPDVLGGALQCILLLIQPIFTECSMKTSQRTRVS